MEPHAEMIFPKFSANYRSNNKNGGFNLKKLFYHGLHSKSTILNLVI